MGGKAAHVDADLGDQLLGGGGADPGDLIELGRLAGERADRRLDLGVKGGDLLAVPVDVVQHHPQDRRVVVGEEPAQRLLQASILSSLSRAEAIAMGAAGMDQVRRQVELAEQVDQPAPAVGRLEGDRGAGLELAEERHQCGRVVG